VKAENAENLLARAEETRNLIEDRQAELAFLNRIMAQVTLPHSKPTVLDPLNPKKRVELYEFEGSDGNVSLYVESQKVSDGRGGWSRPGLPYGAIPRLILVYINTYAVRHNSRKVILGSSLSEFMRELGITPAWGKNGRAVYVIDQLNRLLSCRFAFAKVDPVKKRQQSISAAVTSFREDALLWWDERTPEQMTLEPSSIVLSEEFFEFIRQSPLPLYMDVLREIKDSALALDLYVWLSYRTHPNRLKENYVLKWAFLKKQLGTGYSDIDNFVRAVKEQLPKLYTAWEEPPAVPVRGGLMLIPTRPLVPEKLR